MKDIFAGKQRERIEDAKKRTERYQQALNPDQQERIDTILNLAPSPGEKIPYKQKKELMALKKQMTSGERKYFSALYKEMALYS